MTATTNIDYTIERARRRVISREGCTRPTAGAGHSNSEVSSANSSPNSLLRRTSPASGSKGGGEEFSEQNEVADEFSEQNEVAVEAGCCRCCCRKGQTGSIVVCCCCGGGGGDGGGGDCCFANLASLMAFAISSCNGEVDFGTAQRRSGWSREFGWDFHAGRWKREVDEEGW